MWLDVIFSEGHYVQRAPAASADTHSDDRLGTFCNDMIFLHSSIKFDSDTRRAQRKGIPLGDGQGRPLKGQVHPVRVTLWGYSRVSSEDQLQTLQKTLKNKNMISWKKNKCNNF